MALLSPDIGDLGTFVIGTAETIGSLSNGQEGVIGSMELPGAGIWMITASGWWPTTITSGFVYLSDNGITLGGIGNQNYEFCLAGMKKATEKCTVQLKAVNWSGNTVSNVNAAGLAFRAVKVGNA